MNSSKKYSKLKCQKTGTTVPLWEWYPWDSYSQGNLWIHSYTVPVWSILRWKNENVKWFLINKISSNDKYAPFRSLIQVPINWDRTVRVPVWNAFSFLMPESEKGTSTYEIAYWLATTIPLPKNNILHCAPTFSSLLGRTKSEGSNASVELPSSLCHQRLQPFWKQFCIQLENV